jgi:ribonuclease HII
MSIHDAQGAKQVPDSSQVHDEVDFSSMSVAAVTTWLKDRAEEDGPWRARLESDRRVGVRRLATSHAARLQKAEKERQRLDKMLDWERRLAARGIEIIAGVDEAGRGCLAGPVVAAAVVLPQGKTIAGLDDSKKLKPETRERLFEQINREAVAVGVGVVEAAEIDRINILQAALKAMRLALEKLGLKVGHVLVDGDRCPRSPFDETALVEGDARSLSIAAASVVAKVSRDRFMVKVAAEYPQYGFAGHKGYGSPEHLAALREHGPCPLHRRSFGPVAELLRPRSSEAYLTFREGIDNSGTEAELERMGQYIREGAELLAGAELEDLRQRYRRKMMGWADLGQKGEAAAAEYLRDKGYRLLERSFAAAGGEIDIVAEHGECLVFVEVKSSRATGRPEQRVDGEKRRHLVQAALAYMAGQAREARFDVVAVEAADSEPRIHHWENAFGVEDS